MTIRVIVCRMDIQVRRMAMKHGRSEGYYALAAVRKCDGAQPTPLAVANVAFRSAKAAFFRRAKGNIGSAILNRVKR